MSWPWHQTPWKCPACGEATWKRDDTEEGRLLESEEECRSCGLYAHEFHYGHYEERIGFAVYEWSYSDEDTNHEDRRAASEELRRIYAHPDFAAMRQAPLWALADWLSDNGCSHQERHVRARILAEKA